MVSVDGDTSTNDTLAIMASDKAGNKKTQLRMKITRHLLPV